MDDFSVAVLHIICLLLFLGLCIAIDDLRKTYGKWKVIAIPLFYLTVFLFFASPFFLRLGFGDEKSKIILVIMSFVICVFFCVITIGNWALIVLFGKKLMNKLPFILNFFLYLKSKGEIFIRFLGRWKKCLKNGFIFFLLPSALFFLICEIWKIQFFEYNWWLLFLLILVIMLTIKIAVSISRQKS